MMNTQPISDNFESEIQEVHFTLLAATNDLTNPLGDLVRAQIYRSQPPIYGAVVLAVSKSHSPSQESDDLHRKRILLAAALEMLHVALNVHRLLVRAAMREHTAAAEPVLDRSFIGSTILAGDYCFSRAAQMAAQTDHPRVVATFALALQTVSEELLREQFDGAIDRTGYDETRHLLHAGAHAAAQLVDMSEPLEAQNINLCDKIFFSGTSSSGETMPESWRALTRWLQHQRANGEQP